MGSKESKETYYSVKRDLLKCQKRPTTVSKETYYSVKRDLLQCQKRPTKVSKETYYSVKRDLLTCRTKADSARAKFSPPGANDPNLYDQPSASFGKPSARGTLRETVLLVLRQCC